MTRRYPTQALLLYAALGIALGLVGWALVIHDSDSEQAAGSQAPPALEQGRNK